MLSSDNYFENYTQTMLMVVIQSLAFNCPNIVIAVTDNDEAVKYVKQSEDIIKELGYDPVIIGSNRIKIKNFQSYIIFEPVFDKYKGSGFLTLSIMESTVSQ